MTALRTDTTRRMKQIRIMFHDESWETYDVNPVPQETKYGIQLARRGGRNIL